MKEVLQEILQGISNKHSGWEVILVVGEDDVSHCVSMVPRKDAYYLLLQVAKDLSGLRVADERVVKSCLLKSGGEVVDKVACSVGEDLDEFPHFLAAVRLEGEKKFAVWGKGYPVVLCYYAMRTCMTMEKMNGEPFDSPSVSPFTIFLN